MRTVPLLISALVTLFLIYCLNRSWNNIPPLGSFLSPQHGFWQNAEDTDQAPELSYSFPQLKDKVDVYFDERMVPHVFATNEADAFFIQGYLHARFRLWQMEFQARAAAGRLSEVLGPGKDNLYLKFDRQMRRLGMVYAARKAVMEIEKQPATRMAAESYAAGVNAYISQLTSSQLPLEYKLLNYRPEPWTLLKSALFLKYMSLDLAGPEKDFEMTNAKSVFGKKDFNKVYPVMPDSLDPVIPRGTVFDPPGIHVKTPASADSLYFQWKDAPSIEEEKPNQDNGSNNWAVAGTLTQSGRPILCNDPHLSLNLPSLWYEMQIQTPQFNVYGVSFPGSPLIVIGFNDSCAFGFTNAMRDVRDYYRIRFKDKSRKEYWFDSAWKPARQEIDTFHIRGQKDFYDTVSYTVFGPVMYDASFLGMGNSGRSIRTDGGNYAVRWKAHDPSNELMFFYSLDHARNYEDYHKALPWLTCPGQNCVFASKSGDIALWQQGVFPAKWKRQGDFIMPGTDSSYMWQGNIPQRENPHMVNPERGFVSSANQLAVDTAYPYYIGGHHDLYRGKMINRLLSGMQSITSRDMEHLQTNNYNLFAQTALPVLLHHIDTPRLTALERKYFDIVRRWDLRDNPQEKGVAVFSNWFDSLEVAVWADEFSSVPKPWDWPEQFTLAEALIRDTAFSFIDNVNTPQKETLSDVVTAAFQRAVPVLARLDSAGRLIWTRFKDTGVRHLLQLAPLSRLHLVTGGGLNVINATQQYHGPSWRMVVQLTDETEAYGIYPGGQSGNPGSKYYDTFVDNWAAGNYYQLWVMKPGDVRNRHIISHINFTK